MIFVKYTDEQLLGFIREYNDIYGFPKQRDFNKIEQYPNHVTYFNRFGSFQNAIVLAGIEIPDNMNKLMNRKNKYNKNDVLKELTIVINKFQQDNIGLPPYQYVEDNSGIISEAMICRMFGNLKTAYNLLGFEDDYNDSLIKDDMIDKYLKIADTIGKTPTSRDIERFSKNGDGEFYSMSTYINRFGNLSEVESMLNMDGNCKTRYITKEELISRLHELYRELGDVPMQQDINDCKHIPNIGKTLRVLGYKSIVQLQKELFGRQYNKIKVTKRGTLCLSQYEYTLARTLEKYEYNFKKDQLYKKYIESVESNISVDFVIESHNKCYFIEIFGITGVESYDIKTRQKIDICENANIPILALYPKDFYRMNQDKWNKKIIDFIHNN